MNSPLVRTLSRPPVSCILIASGVTLALAGLCAAPLSAAEPEPAAAEARLVAVGALSATSMVSTQSFLGVVADGIVEGLYKKAEEVEPELNQVVSSLEGSLKAVEQVRKQKLTDADQTFLKEIGAVFTLQQTQAQALAAYARSKDQAELRKWKVARDESQKKIDALLGTGDEGLVVFENVKEKLNPALAAKFVSFRLQHPESWTLDVGVGHDDAGAFVRATSNAEENGKKYLLEQLTVGPLLLKAEPTKETEKELLKEKAEELVSQIAKAHPKFKKTSEGPLAVGKYKGYGFEFTDLDQKAGEEDTDVYGRIVLLPPSATKQANGLLVTVLATTNTEGIDAQGDLGTKGELPLLLETFELGLKQPPKVAPAPSPNAGSTK